MFFGVVIKNFIVDRKGTYVVFEVVLRSVKYVGIVAMRLQRPFALQIGVYSYTIFAIQQEKFLDDFDMPEEIDRTKKE